MDIEEFDPTELDDSQDAFLTRLNRMHLLIEKFSVNAAGRNDITAKLVPFLTPEVQQDLFDNMIEHVSCLDAMSETLELLSKDVLRMGNAITDHMEYIDRIVKEIEEE